MPTNSPLSNKTMSEANPALTRQKLIDSALHLFWLKGHKPTSVDDIASGAGQSKGAFFHHFKSKKEITLIILDKYVEEHVLAPIDNHFNKYNSHKEGLLSWAHEIYEATNKKQNKGGCLLGNFALEIGIQDKELREHIARLFLDWENHLVSHFKKEERRGTILMETRQFARIVIHNYQGMMMSTQLHRDQRRTAREFQAMAELFERLIKD
tara:strand:- start:627 stop:1256 length:630 start_codon:yes stop_codon:yes gene_type:complete